MSAVIAPIFRQATKYRYIYNHDIMNCTTDGVQGVHLYSGRALGLTQPWDIIQLHENLKPLWPDITLHYDRIGLKHTKNVIWYLNLKQLGLHIGYHPSVFFFGPDEYENWGDFEWYRTVNFINSKNNFIALAGSLGMETPETLCFNYAGQINTYSLRHINYPCYLKAAVSVSGVGIYRCVNAAELAANLLKFEPDTPVQIQQEIQTDIFLNLQYSVENGELKRLAVSEQILDGFCHQGNRAPARYEPWECVEPMAIWLKNRGIKGVFAFDVAAVQTSSGLRFLAIECNPRFNGATYPTLIAHKLGIPRWTAITCTTDKYRLQDIDIRDIEYSKKTGQGVVVVNWGTLLAGKIMFLLAGSNDCQDALKIELAARLC